MKTKSSSKIIVNAAISFGGAAVIFSIACKMLHLPWAENMIAGAFFLESLLFFIMGIQYLSDRNSKTDIAINGINNKEEHPDTATLISAIEELNKSSKISHTLLNSLISGVNLEKLSESIKQVSDYVGIDSTGIQPQIDETVDKLKRYNESIAAITKIYNAQRDAFKSN